MQNPRYDGKHLVAAWWRIGLEVVSKNITLFKNDIFAELEIFSLNMSYFFRVIEDICSHIDWGHSYEKADREDVGILYRCEALVVWI